MPWNLIFAAHSLSDCLLQRKKACCCNNWQADCCNIAYIVRRFPFRFPFLLTYHKIIIKCKTYKRSNGKGGIRTPGAWQHNTLAKYHLNPLDHFSKSQLSGTFQPVCCSSLLRRKWMRQDSNLRCFRCERFTVSCPRRWAYASSNVTFQTFFLLSMVRLYHSEQCKFALVSKILHIFSSVSLQTFLQSKKEPPGNGSFDILAFKFKISKRISR